MEVAPAIELHIEELVLHGFDPGDRSTIADAVQSELSRLFAGDAAPAALERGVDVARIDGERFTVAPGSNADAIGGQIAQSIYGGLIR